MLDQNLYCQKIVLATRWLNSLYFLIWKRVLSSSYLMKSIIPYIVNVILFFKSRNTFSSMYWTYLFIFHGITMRLVIITLKSILIFLFCIHFHKSSSYRLINIKFWDFSSILAVINRILYCILKVGKVTTFSDFKCIWIQ
jgi:hypothetical protein